MSMEMIHSHFSTLHSTNTYCKEHLSSFKKGALYLITTDEQTEGRGRFGKKWLSGKEELLATLCFFTENQEVEFLSLTHLLALSLIPSLEKRGVAALIKWPNDLMVNRKKIGGILCETVPTPNGFWVILGIGLNVNTSAQTLEALDQKATSLLLERGKVFSTTDIGKELHALFKKNLSLFLERGFTPFQKAYFAHLLT